MSNSTSCTIWHQAWKLVGRWSPPVWNSEISASQIMVWAWPPRWPSITLLTESLGSGSWLKTQVKCQQLLKSTHMLISREVRPTQQPTVMEAAIASLQRPIFALNLKKDSSGTLDFGHVESALYDRSFISASVNSSKASWVIDKVTLATEKMSVTHNMLFGAVLSVWYPGRSRLTILQIQAQAITCTPTQNL